MFNCFNSRHSSSNSRLYSLVLNQIFDDNPAEIHITREYTYSPQPDLDSSDEQLPVYFPRTSISSDASVSAVSPISYQRLGSGITPPEYSALPPRPASPIEIVNDLDDDNDFGYPSLYRHLSVQAHEPSLMHPWFVTKRPAPFIRPGLLAELTLTHNESTIITCTRITSIAYIGATWVDFRAERDDARGDEVKEIKLIVPRIWSELPHFFHIRDFFHYHARVDVHEPFDPAGDRQIAARLFIIPVHLEHADEEVKAYKRRVCKMAILTGQSRYVL